MSAHTSIRPAGRASVIRRWQIGLIALGLVLMVVGGLVLLADVAPSEYLGILVWLAGAVIIHDGIIAPAVFGIGLVMRKTGRRIPFAVIAIIQGAIVVGAIMTLVVFPQVLKKNIGTANPTVLPLDYGPNLLVFYAVMVVLTALAVVGYLVLSRRSRSAAPMQEATTELPDER